MHSLAEELVVLHFIYVRQSLSALLPMAACVVVHSFGINFARLAFNRALAGVNGTLHSTRRAVVLVGIIAIILTTHWAEVLVWSIFFLLLGILPTAKEAVLVSFNAYTTMGNSGITLSHQWLGFDGFEAMTAMLMFGWSTAVLAVMVERLHSVDR
jgi:hypothetical protein